MPNEIQESEDQKAVDQYLRQERSLDDLTLEQMEIAMQQQLNQDSKPPETAVEPEQVSQVQTQAEKAIDVDPMHEKLREMQVQLNQAKQKERTASDRYNRMKTDEVYRNKELGVEKSYTYDKNQDMLDDEYLGQIEIQKQQIAELTRVNQERAQRDLEEDNRVTANKANDALFNDINRMQEEYPSLKTSLPFREFNDKYNSWNNKMSQSGKDINKYMTDETYRNAVDSEGLAPDLQLNDINVGLDIFSGVHKMNEEIEAGYKSDFAHAFKETKAYKSAYDSRFRGPELANEQALNNRVNEINSQAQILRPNEGSVGADTQMSLLQELDSPNLTDARFEEINQILLAQQKH